MENITTPFFGAREVRQGRLTRRQLLTDHQQVLPGVYLPRGIEIDAVHKAHAAWVWSKGRAVLTGRSAAAVWGVSGIPPDAPAAIATPDHLRPPAGVEIYRTAVADDEHTDWLSVRLTTPARTAYEIGRRLPFNEALPLVEQLYHRTGLMPEHVAAIALRHPRVHGAGRLRRLLATSRTGVRTPFQSRARAEILRSRLPHPEAMIEVYDERGLNRCQAHIGWRRERVAVQCFELGSPAEFENLNALVQHGWLTFAVHACPDRSASAEFGAFLGHRVRCALLSRAADLR